MSRGFIKKRKGDMPQNYYRSGLSVGDIRLAMEGAGWLTVTQVSAIVGDKITPEAKARAVTRKQHSINKPLPELMFTGVRIIVQERLSYLTFNKFTEKQGSGKDAKYRWIADKDNQTGQDSPGRGHAEPQGTE